MSDHRDIVDDLRRVLIPDGYPISQARVRSAANEIARLLPYVEAFQREETRADKAEQKIDDLNDEIASLRAQLARMIEQSDYWRQIAHEDRTRVSKLEGQLASARKALEVALRQWRFYADMEAGEGDGRDLAKEETFEGAEYRGCRAALSDELREVKE